MPFQRLQLQPGKEYELTTQPPLPSPQAPNLLVPLLRFICNPEIASKLLVKVSIEGHHRSSQEFVSGALASLISLNAMVDPSKPITMLFMATEPLVADCGIVCKLRSLLS